MKRLSKTLYLCLLISCLFQFCGISKMLPSKPVMKEDSAFLDLKNKTPDYSYGDQLCDIPVIPFQIFGVTYAQDIVLVSKHPEWDMHEFSRIDLPDGTSTWIVKDSKKPTLDQYLTTSSKELIQWLPEIPAHSLVSAASGRDRSAPTHVRYRHSRCYGH
jgi:hypothetical protein